MPTTPSPCLHLAPQLSPSMPQEAWPQRTLVLSDPRVLPGKGWVSELEMELGMEWGELGPQASHTLAHTACSFWYLVRVPGLILQMSKLRPREVE